MSRSDRRRGSNDVHSVNDEQIVLVMVSGDTVATGLLGTSFLELLAFRNHECIVDT